MGSETKKYDFIVVGSGPAGATVASRLARSKQAPSILLLEAGGPNADLDKLVLVERFATLATVDMNWGYKTVPQARLNGRQIDYSRGKGLGGSSAINFACFTVGPRDDYDEWARLVGDDAFGWPAARARYDRIETYDFDTSDETRHLVRPAPGAHGHAGPLQIEYPKALEWGYKENVEAAEAIGMKLNLDVNSGDPIGIGLAPSTARKSVRSTARTAFLTDVPENLTIVTGALVERVVFEGKRAVGVVANGETFLAANEVVISAGALDSPKLLMLSGVGPADELAKHSIPLVHELAGVGQNLQDHPYVPLIKELTPGLNRRRALFGDPDALEAAKTQFAADGTGPFSVFYNSVLMGWQKDPAVLASAEFAALPAATRAAIERPTVPTFEHCALCPAIVPTADPHGDLLSFIMIEMVPQSTGAVTLASADARDPPLCDPRLMEHPFDRRNLIEATRRGLDAFAHPAVSGLTTGDFCVPKSASDDDVWAFVQDNLGTTWHMTGTVKMGRAEDAAACVDTSFRVRGVEGLRVVDNSVPPFVLNCHVVSVAYLMGQTAAEKIAEEYGYEL